MTDLVVHKTVRVPLSPERAFALFTERIVDFWPSEHSIGDAKQVDVVIEPHVGGRWFERDANGDECDWGKVAGWEPPGRLVLLWQLGTNWRYDPELATEVEVTFTSDDGRTRVDLWHRQLERYGDQAREMYASFDSPDGWSGILGAFVAVA